MDAEINNAATNTFIPDFFMFYCFGISKILPQRHKDTKKTQKTRKYIVIDRYSFSLCLSVFVAKKVVKLGRTRKGIFNILC